MPAEGGPSILVVLGSVTPPGRLRGALDGAVARAKRHGLDASLLDLAERRLAFADGRDPRQLGDDTAAVVAAVEAAEALVFASPVYRGSITGALKNLFDQLPVPSLTGKVVGGVAMGGSDHHFLGAERHLRDVLAFFGAQQMPVDVYLTARDFSDGVAGDRARNALDDLLTAVAATATALASAESGPAPLAAAAAKS